MRLLVFGATGGTGRHLVEQALARGHEATAFVAEFMLKQVTDDTYLRQTPGLSY